MYTTEKKVTPQKEEDIEEVAWKKLTAELIQDIDPIYSNIKDVLRVYLNLVT